MIHGRPGGWLAAPVPGLAWRVLEFSENEDEAFAAALDS
jgi:hypothetical protein